MAEVSRPVTHSRNRTAHPIESDKKYAGPNNTAQLTDIQINCMTEYTKTGRINMTNRKPFRTKALKIEARRLARKDGDGAWRSHAPKLYHDKPKNR